MTEPFRWQSAEAEKQGMNGEKLRLLAQNLASRGGTKVLLIARHDRIVCEWYAADYSPTRPHYTASLAKALVGGTSLLLALSDGLMGVDDLACQYIPRWKKHPEKSKITIRHLATHTSGIQDAKHDQPGGWECDFWAGRWGKKPDPISIALDQAPILFPPGSAYAYSNPGMAALAYAVTASLRETPHRDIYDLLKARILDPIEVPEQEWSIGYGKPYEVDGMRVYANWGGGEFSARATVSLGRLMLRRGDWEGRQLIPSAWVDKAVSYAGMPSPKGEMPEGRYDSGLCWWTNILGAWSQLPRDSFAGAGSGHQVLLVVPSLDLIIIRYGDTDLGDLEEGGWWSPLVEHLFNPVMEAVG